jgi:hypothetical protein
VQGPTFNPECYKKEKTKISSEFKVYPVTLLPFEITIQKAHRQGNMVKTALG